MESSDNNSEPVSKKDRLVLEVGWEVCQQLGGIYTVLRSRAPLNVEELGDRFALLGPYNAKTAQVEFEEQKLEGVYGRAVERINGMGFRVLSGRWMIPGRPQVILVDFLHSFQRIADYKYYLWKDHQIQCGDDQEVNDVVIFGYIAVEVIQGIIDLLKEEGLSDDVPLVALFHEWMAAVPVPEIRRRKLPVATVFHTHATLLGRYLAPGNPFLYDSIWHIDPYQAARDNGIESRFAIERSAAWSASVFTTLSDVTSIEAEHFLGRKPDMLLPNGLNIRRFAAIHEFQNLHAFHKNRIHEFVMAHFFPSYNFDIDKTVYIFSSGRYEHTNKGFDVYLEALARLNGKLQARQTDLTVVAFLITRAATKAVNVDALKNRVLFNELEAECKELGEKMGIRLLQKSALGEEATIDDLMDQDEQVKIKRLSHAWKRQSLPPVCTHDMVFDAEDAILNQIRTIQLFNREEDPVKVIYHPEFLSGTNPPIGMDYDHFVRGCHLGVFPSFYEPWGYTPMECAALGIPSITSDLAGFGTYIRSNIEDHEKKGLHILQRRGKSFWDASEELACTMERFLFLSQRERIEMRNRVEGLSEQFDWGVMKVNYDAAMDLALERTRETIS